MKVILEFGRRGGRTFVRLKRGRVQHHLTPGGLKCVGVGMVQPKVVK